MTGGDAAAADFVARLVPLDRGFYAFTLAAEIGLHEPAGGLLLPAVQVCAPPDRDVGIEVTDMYGQAQSWLGGEQRVLFVKSAGGGVALVTAYLARDPDAPPLAVEIRRLGGGGHGASVSVDEPSGPPSTPLLTLQLAGNAVPEGPQPASLDVVAHIRGRGDVRFVDAPWIGRLGTGRWIEAFTVTSRNRPLAAAIEYKGLTARGAETPWLTCGAQCGTRGRSTPLVGFAVRQKAGLGGARYDCEYSGYFQSGATVGPMRNGAPCRSERDFDPLEGLQLHITPRPPRPFASGGAA